MQIYGCVKHANIQIRENCKYTDTWNMQIYRYLKHANIRIRETCKYTYTWNMQIYGYVKHANIQIRKTCKYTDTWNIRMYKTCCIAMNNYTYTYAYRNIFNTIKTSRHSSLEKYTSHFIWKGSKVLLKVLLCERWVEDRTELQHIDPHSSGYHSLSFPFSWATQPEAWGPSLSGTWSSFQHLLSNWSELPVAGVI